MSVHWFWSGKQILLPRIVFLFSGALHILQKFEFMDPAVWKRRSPPRRGIFGTLRVFRQIRAWFGEWNCKETFNILDFAHLRGWKKNGSLCLRTSASASPFLHLHVLKCEAYTKSYTCSLGGHEPFISQCLRRKIKHKSRRFHQEPWVAVTRAGDELSPNSS